MALNVSAPKNCCPSWLTLGPCGTNGRETFSTKSWLCVGLKGCSSYAMAHRGVSFLKVSATYVKYVEDVKFVINYDYPNCSEDYVHRIGRTGRSAKTGTAYTFFTKTNGKQAKDLIDVLREANQVINPKLYELMQDSRGGDRRGGFQNRSRWRQTGSGGGGGRGYGGGGYGQY